MFLSCSPVMFPCYVPLLRSPVVFPCYVPLLRSPVMFPCCVPLLHSPVMFPCHVPLSCSPVTFPCYVPLLCSISPRTPYITFITRHIAFLLFWPQLLKPSKQTVAYLGLARTVNIHRILGNFPAKNTANIYMVLA
jgi:hypothetical protein